MKCNRHAGQKKKRTEAWDTTPQRKLHVNFNAIVVGGKMVSFKPDTF